MNDLVFKGGTALRKLYAGTAGRFSLDLDFSVRDIGTQSNDVLDLLEDHVSGLTLGPFSYGIATRRGKRHLLMSSTTLGSAETLSSKLDVSSPPWVEPIERTWVPMPVHAAYGGPLPVLPVVRLEENLAEKIARLNRVTPARDMYDLKWVADHHLRTMLDVGLIRRLAVLKVWVDSCGISTSDTVWPAAHSGVSFEPAKWLRQRDPKDYDEDDIGVLAVPPPKFEALSAAVSGSYAFLADLDADEQVIAGAQQADRSLALRMLQELPGGRLADLQLR